MGHYSAGYALVQHVHYVTCGREILSAVGRTAKAIFARELLKPIFASVERDPSPWTPALGVPMNLGPSPQILPSSRHCRANPPTWCEQTQHGGRRGCQRGVSQEGVGKLLSAHLGIAATGFAKLVAKTLKIKLKRRMSDFALRPWSRWRLRRFKKRGSAMNPRKDPKNRSAALAGALPR
jgi:hypothetical protein